MFFFIKHLIIKKFEDVTEKNVIEEMYQYFQEIN